MKARAVNRAAGKRPRGTHARQSAIVIRSRCPDVKKLLSLPLSVEIAEREQTEIRVVNSRAGVFTPSYPTPEHPPLPRRPIPLSLHSRGFIKRHTARKEERRKKRRDRTQTRLRGTLDWVLRSRQLLRDSLRGESSRDRSKADRKRDSFPAGADLILRRNKHSRGAEEFNERREEEGGSRRPKKPDRSSGNVSLRKWRGSRRRFITKIAISRSDVISSPFIPEKLSA